MSFAIILSVAFFEAVAEFSWHALQHLSTSPRVIHCGQTVYCKISCISLQRTEPRHIKSLVTHAFWQTVCRSGLSWSHFMTSLSLAWGTCRSPMYLEGFHYLGGSRKCWKARARFGWVGYWFITSTVSSHTFTSVVENCSFSCLGAAFRHGPCFLFN